jgi:hypothetical protein
VVCIAFIEHLEEENGVQIVREMSMLQKINNYHDLASFLNMQTIILINSSQWMKLQSLWDMRYIFGVNSKLLMAFKTYELPSSVN